MALGVAIVAPMINVKILNMQYLTSGKRFALWASLILCLSSVQMKAQTTQSDNKQKFDTYCYQGVLLSNIQQLNEGLALLNYCYQLDSTNAVLQYQLSRLYYTMEEPGKAQNLLEKAYKSEPKNRLFSEALAGVYVANQEYNKALEIYTGLTKQFPSDEDLGLRVARLYGLSGNVDEAIKQYDQLQKRYASSLFEHMRYINLKSDLYSMAGKKDEIVREYTNLIKRYPESLDVRYALVRFCMNQNNFEELKKQNEVLEAMGDNSVFFYASKIFYLSKSKQEDLVVTTLNKMMAQNDILLEQRIVFLMDWIRTSDKNGKIGEYDEKYKPCFEILLKSNPDSEQVLQAYMQYMFMIGKLEETEPVLLQMADRGFKSMMIWDYLLQIYSSDVKKTAQTAKRAIALYPDRPIYYVYLSGALYQMGDKKAAYDCVKQSLAAIAQSDNKVESATLYGQLGDLANELTTQKESFEAYEKALELDSNNMAVLNNYAYALSKDKSTLNKAEHLAARALQQDENNPVVLDTYGWILFLKGNMTMAKLYVQKSVDQDPDGGSAEVLEHLGDIYAKMNMMDKALEYWKKSQAKQEKPNALLDRKIKEKKYFEQ